MISARNWVSVVRHRLKIVVVILFAIVLAIQFVPYGHNHTNPPVRREPAWNNPQTRQLAVRACYDCHSNETAWPWYSNVAPMSWLIQHDVDQGRQELNFSEWDRRQDGATEAAQSVQEGTMPPRYYTAIQTKAQLSSTQIQTLIAGLQATFGGGTGHTGERD